MVREANLLCNASHIVCEDERQVVPIPTAESNKMVLIALICWVKPRVLVVCCFHLEESWIDSEALQQL